MEDIGNIGRDGGGWKCEVSLWAQEATRFSVRHDAWLRGETDTTFTVIQIKEFFSVENFEDMPFW